MTEERKAVFERAAAILAARPLSRAELTKRLREKGATEEDAEAAADYMETLGALDDPAYAGMVVRHYTASGYGAARLREELRRRGVPRELWDDALAEAPPAEETIARVIASKARGRGAERKKLSAMLLRRGFSWEEVRAALESLDAESAGEG